jgi:hypothetical protein
VDRVRSTLFGRVEPAAVRRPCRRFADGAMDAKRPRGLTLSAKESLILQLLVRDDEAYGIPAVSR